MYKLNFTVKLNTWPGIDSKYVNPRELDLKYIKTHGTDILAFNFFLKKLYGPFSWIGRTRRQFTFQHQIPSSLQYSFDWPWKEERSTLSQPCTNWMVVNLAPLDWESSKLTFTWLLLTWHDLSEYDSKIINVTFVFVLVSRLHPTSPQSLITKRKTSFSLFMTNYIFGNWKHSKLWK